MIGWAATPSSGWWTSSAGCCDEYGVAFDAWSSEQRDVRDAGLARARRSRSWPSADLTYEHDGALWFRSTRFGDDKDRVLRRSNGELTYFAVDIAYHHCVKFAAADRVITLIGPDHHGYVGRLRAAMQALGHPPEALEILIVQLVTLLRDGQPVRMSKRRGEFVLMEELLEEVGRDAARFTFLTRRHDSPLDFDLAVAARQTADNPVYYVQYAHARIRSIARQAAEQGIAVPAWDEIDTSVADPSRGAADHQAPPPVPRRGGGRRARPASRTASPTGSRSWPDCSTRTTGSPRASRTTARCRWAAWRCARRWDRWWRTASIFSG